MYSICGWNTCWPYQRSDAIRVALLLHVNNIHTHPSFFIWWFPLSPLICFSSHPVRPAPFPSCPLFYRFRSLFFLSSPPIYVSHPFNHSVYCRKNCWEKLKSHCSVIIKMFGLSQQLITNVHSNFISVSVFYCSILSMCKITVFKLFLSQSTQSFNACDN